MIEPTTAALAEPGHIGYVLSGPAGRIVVDAPLTGEIDPVGIIAIIETSIPTWRISGARLLAERGGLPVLGPTSTSAMQRVSPGSIIGDLVMVRSVLGELDRLALISNNEATVLIGSLDQDPDGGPSRKALAEAHPTSRFLGASGSYTATELADLAPSAPPPLNRHAVTLTNRGDADLYWADPRFPEPATATTRDQLAARLAGPWPPTVVCVDAAPDQVFDGARLIPAESLASSVSALAGERELVIQSNDRRLAEAAAGFLVRLGLNAVWLAD